MCGLLTRFNLRRVQSVGNGFNGSKKALELLRNLSRVGLQVGSGGQLHSESRARNARQTVTLTREVSTELELSGILALSDHRIFAGRFGPHWGCQKVRCLESFVALPSLICKARSPNPFTV